MKTMTVTHVDGKTKVLAKGKIINNEFVGEYKYQGMTYGVHISVLDDLLLEAGLKYPKGVQFKSTTTNNIYSSSGLFIVDDGKIKDAETYVPVYTSYGWANIIESLNKESTSLNEPIYCGHTCKCTCIEECQFANKMEELKVKTEQEIHELAEAWSQSDPDQPYTSKTDWECKIAYNSYIKGYQDAQSHITKLEARTKELEEALTFVKLYLSTKTVEGFEAYTIAEQALNNPK